MKVVSIVGTTVVENNVVYAVFAPNVNFNTLLFVCVTIVCVTIGAVVIWNCGCCGNNGFIGGGGMGNDGNDDVPISYSVLLTVATGLDIVLKLVEMPLKIGMTCDSYTVSKRTTGLDVVMICGSCAAAPGLISRKNAKCCN